MSTHPHHPYWGDNRLAERETLREFPRDDPRLATWADDPLDRVLSILSAVGWIIFPVIVLGIYFGGDL